VLRRIEVGINLLVSNTNKEITTMAQTTNVPNPLTGLAAAGLVSQFAAMAAARFLPASMQNNFTNFIIQVWQWFVGPGLIVIGTWLHHVAAQKAVKQASVDGERRGKEMMRASMTGSLYAQKSATVTSATVGQTSLSGPAGGFDTGNAVTGYRPLVPVLAVVLTLVAGGLLGGSTGCQLFATSQPSLAADAQFIQNTEQAIQLAIDAINAFVQLDGDNRALMASKYPSLHAVANDLRMNVPALTKAAEAALAAYKANESPENALAVNTALSAVQSKAASARSAQGRVAAELKK